MGARLLGMSKEVTPKGTSALCVEGFVNYDAQPLQCDVVGIRDELEAEIKAEIAKALKEAGLRRRLEEIFSDRFQAIEEGHKEEHGAEDMQGKSLRFRIRIGCDTDFSSRDSYCGEDALNEEAVGER